MSPQSIVAIYGSLSLLCVGLMLLAWLWVTVHAFRRSVGTAVLVLLMPLYGYVYAFTQFEHPRKGWIATGMVAFAVLAAFFLLLGLGVQLELEPALDVDPAGI